MNGKTKLIIGSIGAVCTAIGAIIELAVQFVPESNNKDEKAE